MKRFTYISFSLLLIISLQGCDKSSGTEPDKPEEKIVFTIDPDPGQAVAPATSATYTFKVNLTSAMPTAGIVVDLKTVKEMDNSTIDSKSLDSKQAQVSLSTGDIQPGILYLVMVTVTSKSTLSNTQSKTFKVARK